MEPAGREFCEVIIDATGFNIALEVFTLLLCVAFLSKSADAVNREHSSYNSPFRLTSCRYFIYIRDFLFDSDL